MKVHKSTILKWTQALRSGEYKQGRNRLQCGTEFCCLGVACKMFVPSINHITTEFGELSGEFPHDQYKAPRWLRGINDHFNLKTGAALSLLNDGAPVDDQTRYSFDEIADLLEAVYVHDALKQAPNIKDKNRLRSHKDSTKD